mmetsp:Transcript_150314/g.418831  ORF Transcript_150314/g.418831 Transcript_150314/m.418831 type:complete len:239 (+) Transcript_150314:330-1046(+)
MLRVNACPLLICTIILEGVHQQVQLKAKAQQRPILERKLRKQWFACANVGNVVHAKDVKLCAVQLLLQGFHWVILFLLLLLLDLFLGLVLWRRVLVLHFFPVFILLLILHIIVLIFHLLIFALVLHLFLTILLVFLLLFFQGGLGRCSYDGCPLVWVLELHVLHVPHLEIPLPLLPLFPEPIGRLQVVNASGCLAVEIPSPHSLQAILTLPPRMLDLVKAFVVPRQRKPVVRLAKDKL